MLLLRGLQKWLIYYYILAEPLTFLIQYIQRFVPKWWVRSGQILNFDGHRRETVKKRGEDSATKRRHEFCKADLVKYMGGQAYEEYAGYLTVAIAKLRAEQAALPIGHRYTGRFYLRKPYTMPAAVEEIEGSLFMREDLVTWRREVEGDAYQPWCKAAYKDAAMQAEIKRSEGHPVFE